MFPWPGPSAFLQVARVAVGGCHEGHFPRLNCRQKDPEPHSCPRPYLVESSEGFVRPWLLSSQTLLASSFPMDDITLISSMGQSSRSRDRTRERWVPKFRWIPEHSMHMRAPKFKLAQFGSVGRGPSDHHYSFQLPSASQEQKGLLPDFTSGVKGCSHPSLESWSPCQSSMLIQAF